MIRKYKGKFTIAEIISNTHGGEYTKDAINAGLRQISILRFAIGSFGIILMLVLSSAETLLRFIPITTPIPQHYHWTLLENALRSDTVSPFIPILAALPFSACYIDDLKNKFARYFVIRCGNGTYIISRVCVCFLSGGLAIVTGILITAVLAAIVFVPLEQECIGSSFNAMQNFGKFLLLYFITGGFWAVVGMAMSTIMESKYISYATPFVLYYLLVILYERYVSDLFIIYPKTWTDPAVWPFGCWGAAIFLLEITLIFAALFAFRAGKRLQQL